MVDFEDENGVDDARALQEACRNLDRFEWDQNDLAFTFNQIETQMMAVGVKKQFTKLRVLTTILPKKIVEEVKPILRKKESEFANNDAYKELKTEIFRIFGPRPMAAIDRALGRVMTDRPSTLARALVNDICKKQLVNCECCPAVVEALWKRHLSSQIRAGIAGKPLTKDTFNELTQLADDIWSDNRPASSTASGSVAAVTLDETQPAIPYAVPEVAAIRGGGPPKRGGRGGRGGRGRGGNRGGQSNGGSAQSGGAQ